MIDQNFEIVGLNESVFRRIAEEIVRMPHDELIERRGRRDQHRARTAAAASSTARALPGSRDGAGIAGHHHGVERSDVDAQFQRARGYHAANSSVAQSALDFAPFAGKISAAIAANRFRLPGQLRIGLLQIRQQQFGVQARIGEDHRLQIVLQEFLRHAGGFIDVAATNAERAIHHRRIVEDEGFLRGGRAVRVQYLDVSPRSSATPDRPDSRSSPSSR